jgi:hypothetical protein
LRPNTEGAAEELTKNKASFQEYKERASSSQLTTVAPSGDDTLSDRKGSSVGAIAPLWIPDSGVSMCQLCTDNFTFTKRRHHCRACGKVVCSDCSPYKLPIAYDDDKEGRVCTSCYAEHNGITVEEMPRQRSSSLSQYSRKKEKNSKKPQQNVLNAPAHGIISGKQDSDTIFSANMGQKKYGLLKSYKRFWYVLKRDFCLYQYRAPEDVVAQSALPFPGFSVEQTEKGAPGIDRDFVIRVTHPSQKPMLLDCDNEGNFDMWFKHLDLATRASIEDVSADEADGEDEALPDLPADDASPQRPSSPAIDIIADATTDFDTAAEGGEAKGSGGGSTLAPSYRPQPRPPIPTARPPLPIPPARPRAAANLQSNSPVAAHQDSM